MIKMTICEECGDLKPNCGEFKDSDTGESWKSLCGGCKVKITLTPERKARLVSELERVFGAIIGGSEA